MGSQALLNACHAHLSNDEYQYCAGETEEIKYDFKDLKS
jgi:hypothetical protein